MNLLAAGVLFLTGSCFAEVQNGYQGYKVYRLTPQTQKQVDFLQGLSQDLKARETTDEVDFWSEVGQISLDPEHPVLVMVSPSHQKQFLASMDAQSIPHVVTIPDLAKAIAEESRFSPTDRKAADDGRITWTAYHQYSTIEAYLESLKTAYPDLIQEKKVIGKSFEGRSLHLLKVGKVNPNKKKPAIWIDANIHAREWISSATVLWILNKLVTGYATDPRSRRMLDEIDWYILPVVNVDGFEYTHLSSSTRMWRGTRKVNPFSPNFGADPNRNYDHKWMVAGADQTPRSETYAGPYPYSELENLHVTDAMLALKDDLKAMFSFHCYSQFWLVPWAYGREKPVDYNEIFQAAQKQVEALTKVHGTRYRVGTPPDILYSAAGGTLDFALAKAGIKYSYTPELRDTGSYGFILPPNQIIPSGEETFEAVRVMAEIVHEKYGSA